KPGSVSREWKTSTSRRPWHNCWESASRTRRATYLRRSFSTDRRRPLKKGLSRDSGCDIGTGAQCSSSHELHGFHQIHETFSSRLWTTTNNAACSTETKTPRRGPD